MSSRIPEDLVVNLNSSSIVLNKDYETSKRNFLNTQLGSLGLFGEDDAGGESDVKNMFKDEEASRASIQTTKSIKNLSFDDFIERLLKDSENKPVPSKILLCPPQDQMVMAPHQIVARMYIQANYPMNLKVFWIFLCVILSLQKI